jgi:hypothetical protein
LEAILIESLDQIAQSRGRDAEESLRVRFVVVSGYECGSPGAEGAIGKEFHAADCEAFVETIVDKTRYLGAPIVIGCNVAHQVKLDLE